MAGSGWVLHGLLYHKNSNVTDDLLYTAPAYSTVCVYGGTSHIMLYREVNRVCFPIVGPYTVCAFVNNI